MRDFIRLTGSEFGAALTVRKEDISSIRDVSHDQDMGHTKTILGMCSGSALFVKEHAEVVIQLMEGSVGAPVQHLKSA